MLIIIWSSDYVYEENFVERSKTHLDDFYVSKISIISLRYEIHFQNNITI